MNVAHLIACHGKPPFLAPDADIDQVHRQAHREGRLTTAHHHPQFDPDDDVDLDALLADAEREDPDAERFNPAEARAPAGAAGGGQWAKGGAGGSKSQRKADLLRKAAGDHIRIRSLQRKLEVLLRRMRATVRAHKAAQQHAASHAHQAAGHQRKSHGAVQHAGKAKQQGKPKAATVHHQHGGGSSGGAGKGSPAHKAARDLHGQIKAIRAEIARLRADARACEKKAAAL